MAFYHYSSDKEYHKLLAGVRGDARLNSLAYAGAAVKPLHRLKSKGLLGLNSSAKVESKIISYVKS